MDLKRQSFSGHPHPDRDSGCRSDQTGAVQQGDRCADEGFPPMRLLFASLPLFLFGLMRVFARTFLVV